MGTYFGEDDIIRLDDPYDSNLISRVMYIVIHCSDDEFKLHNAFDIHKLHLLGGTVLDITKLSKEMEL